MRVRAVAGPTPGSAATGRWVEEGDDRLVGGDDGDGAGLGDSGRHGGQHDAGAGPERGLHAGPGKSAQPDQLGQAFGPAETSLGEVMWRNARHRRSVQLSTGTTHRSWCNKCGAIADRVKLSYEEPGWVA